ncbi:MAG: peptidoglycan DD-metalloendopeptidase family protein [Porticoccaceae bacterium]|nr:peptidoglycan DD-metalloendopeptidase family protein [Porticoccaceae bacterium]
MLRIASLTVLPIAILMTLVVTGCSSYSNNHPAPVSSRAQPPSKHIMVHQVEPGETLYSIAWRYDLDFRKLARANGIGAPFVINRGQLLSLDTSKIRTGSAKAVNSKSRKSKASVTAHRQSRVQTKKPAAKKAQTHAVVYVNNWQWQWPVKGKIVESYNPKELHKGIKIKAVSRSAVRSAGPGVVVYSGEGLRGYGKLVIIKHSEILLSAYAHNEQIMVKEGQTVKQMEIISRLGASGTLYFEIRKDGYPINPVTYLK